MKKIVAFLIMVFALFACGGNNATQETQNEKIFYLSGQPKGGDDKVGYFWQDGSGLMPYLLSRGLIISNENFNEIKPDLAEDFKVLDEGKTYEMTLKSNLKWSDGEPITIDDVRFSIETALKASLLNGIFPVNFLKIEGATEFKEGKAEHISGLIFDGNKITIKLVEPVGIFAQVLGQFTLVPKHSLENENPVEIHNNAFWTKPVTNGMYMVDHISPGNYIELVKNPYYEGETPKFDKVRFNYLNSPVVAMQDGKSYMYSTNKPNEISELEKISGLIKEPVNLLFYRYFIANLSGIDGKGKSIVENPKVREALLYAINRKEIVDSLLKGIAEVNNTGVPFPEYYWKDAKTYEYNPEKAKELLTEAGYDFNKTLRIVYYYKDQNSIDMMQAISYQLEQAGIKNEVIQAQSDATTELFKIRKYDIGLKGFSSFGLDSWYGEYASDNTNFRNIYNGDTSFDKLAKDLASTVDEAKKKEILIELQKLEQEKLLKLPLYTIKNFIFINADKVGLPSGFKFGNPFYRYDYDFANWEAK